MSIRVAINGYGRIGRNILKALYESDKQNELKIVAINDLCDPEINAHLTEYDSVHGRFSHSITVSNGYMMINNDKIRVLSETDISALPWKELDVDLVMECTGRFTDKDSASLHLEAGAQKVLISAPATNADATVVYGVNHQKLANEHRIISNASCTTNCLAPLAKILHEGIGIKSGIMTTIHAYTNDQHLTDAYTGDLYRARSAALSMIPTKTGAASAVGLVLPELEGKLSGLAVRVPTSNVSLVDLTIETTNPADAERINQLVKDAAYGKLRNILEYSDKPLVSVDFNHNPSSCIFDSTQTIVSGNQAKVFAWYDNEWGFSNRMIDTAIFIGNLSS
ncbi:type I glyceraldehyde-3-phosphate dehydrogenase [Neptuniibacter sp.]|uniref:type I glyceraldehyde-3-phosphate dehydrogenase n=1 Tax=Neptuniibacter sp. TaxID=1962643 RepID=UPI00260F45CD|nr:type I glyceraldehyde-3-phosphate dehydrogenase [Neptuniibacter sp.]MCP4595373.1 type I glyceraldehyde-3-phosphate dehydrogenase [Neptuniibacter sp.]